MFAATVSLGLFNPEEPSPVDKMYQPTRIIFQNVSKGFPLFLYFFKMCGCKKYPYLHPGGNKKSGGEGGGVNGPGNSRGVL